MKGKAPNVFGEMLVFRTTQFKIFSQRIKVNNGKEANKRGKASVLTLKRDKEGLEVIEVIDDIFRNIKWGSLSTTSIRMFILTQ